ASARIPDGSREESPPETQRSDSGTAIGKSLDSASRAGARDPARPPARPCLTQPAAGKGAADGSFIPCPPDLDLLESQKVNLEMAGAKRWRADTRVLETRPKLLGGPERRPLDGGRNYPAGAVTRRWSTPAERPKDPPPKGPADDPNRKM